MKTWDAVVIGAGPAGSVAARQLARRGLTVKLVDGATFPRRKVCGCCLNRHALSALAEVGLGQLPFKLGAVPLNRIALACGGRSAELKLPGGMALSREAFDGALIDAAVESGATFESGHRLQMAASERSEIILSDGSRAKAVVVATGLNGRAGTEASVVETHSRIGAGAILDDSPRGYEPGQIHMAAGSGGYVGLVRLEDGRLDVAAAFDARFVCEFGLANAAEKIVRESGLPELPQLLDAEWKGTPPLTRTPINVAGPRWYAIGDAAGYIEPFTGEGMAWALASALAVAPLVERAVAGEANLETEWATIHRSCVGRRQWACRALAALLRRPTLCRIAVRGLRIVPALARPVVRSLNRPVFTGVRRCPS